MLFNFMWLRSLVKLTLQPQLSAEGPILLEIGQVGDSYGIFPVRGRLELSKKDHEARGGRAGKVTRWRRKVRAIGYSHPTHRCPGGSHIEVQVIYADVKLASKVSYLLLNLYSSFSSWFQTSVPLMDS